MGDINLIRSTVSGNTGGGVYENVTTHVIGGGELHVSGSIIADNTGPGVYIYDATSTIVDSTISGNSGGGGSFTKASTTSVTITGSTIVGNYGVTHGGGFAGPITLANSTIYGNTATTDGGGLYVVSGTLTVVNVTIAGNTAPRGGGLRRGGGTFTVSNSIVDGNTGTTSDPNCYGTITDDGYNLEHSASSCSFTDHKIAGDPDLTALADNGGPNIGPSNALTHTQTMELGSGSAAIGAGSSVKCEAAPVDDVDQRGVARHSYFRRCDIGAYDSGKARGPLDGQTYGTSCPAWQSFSCVWRLSPEPVNTATGSYVTRVTDLHLPGRGLPFTFTRIYNSIDPRVGPLGPGWTVSYGAHLTLNADGSVTLTSEEGAQALFVPNGSGGFTGANGAAGTLTAITGGYEAVRRDQLRYQFNSAGLLTAMIDRNGNTLSFAYTAGKLTSITDTVGRTITLAYDGSGHLSQITDPSSRLG